MIDNYLNPEDYRGKILHVVHIDSLKRIVRREKPADQSELNKANVILESLKVLEENGVEIKYVENPSQIEHPLSDEEEVIIAGAYDGQCIADYEDTLRKHGNKFLVDRKLSL